MTTKGPEREGTETLQEAKDRLKQAKAEIDRLFTLDREQGSGRPSIDPGVLPEGPGGGADELRRMTDLLLEIREELHRLTGSEAVRTRDAWVRRREACIRRIYELTGGTCPFCARNLGHAPGCALE